MLRFFFPIFLGTLFQSLYSTVDVIILGRFVGKEAFSAVGGSTNTIINLLVGFFIGVSSGATVLIAQKYGAKDEKGTSDAIHTAAAFALIVGAFLTVVGLLVARQALIWMHTTKEVLPYALVYLRIYFCGILFNIVYNIGSSVLRALGDSKRPLYILIVCCFSNILLDLLFVVGLKMETAGVALATILSQGVSASLVTLLLLRAKDSSRLYLRKIKVHGYIFRPLLRIGIPSGIQSSMFGIANLMIQYTVNGFGTDVVAAYTAYNKVDIMLWMILNAFGIAASTFVSQNLGARQKDRAFKSIHAALLLSLIGILVISIPILIFRHAVLGIITTDTTVVNIAADMMMHALTVYVLYIPIEILSGSIRGAGDSLIPMLITCIGICVVRVTWLMVAVPIINHYNAIALCYPVTWVVTALAYIIYYRSHRWLRYYEAKHTA